MKKQKETLKILATLSGNTLEWLEFTLFAYISHKIGTHFFSTDTQALATLKTYMIFGSSYIARPLGALVFGYIGDRLGRVVVLKNSLLLMSFATASIALIPSYENIGILSPILLIFCRLLQGFSISGEFNSSLLILIETFGKDKPFCFGLLGPLSASVGMLLGGLLSSLVYSGFLPENAWRFVFLASSFLGFIAYYLRQTLVESPAFLQAKQENRLKKNPLLEVFKKNKHAFILCFLCSMFISNFVYIASIFYEKLSQNAGFFSNGQVHSVILIGQGLATLTMIFCFFIFKTKKFSAKKLCVTSLLLATFFGPFIIKFSISSSFTLLLLGQILYGLINGLSSSVLLTYVSLAFPSEIRLTGSSFSWSLGAAIFGGSSLLIAETLRLHGHISLIGLYISISALLPLLMFISLKKELKTLNLIY